MYKLDKLFFIFVLFFISTHAIAQTHSLPAGWSLVGNDTGSGIDPVAVFGNATTPTPVSPSVTTVWTWNNSLGQWNFFAPSMTPQALSTYTASKGYGVLSTIIKGEGFWVNAKNAVSVNLVASTSLTATAEGVYSGTVSDGSSFEGIILEDGTYYVLSGVSSAGSLLVSGFLQGNSTSINGTFISTNSKEFFANGTMITGTISASYGVNNSFNGTVTTGATVNSFTGTTPANSSYVYNVGANLADITGAWTLSNMLGGEAISMTITANGSFTASSGGCTFTGTLTPRASGKNVFNFTTIFGASPCSIPGQTATGIAIDYLLANGTRQLIVTALNSSGTVGTAIFGTR